MVGNVLVGATLCSFYMESSELFGASDEVGIRRFCGEVMHESNLSFHQHIFELFLEHIENFSGFAPEHISVDVEQDSGIPILMIDQLDGVELLTHQRSMSGSRDW